MADASLKLLIDKKEKRVLFAEAGKNLVDFLFNFMALPLGTVTRLLAKDGTAMVGSLGNLYESIETLNDSYILPNQKKESILNPSVTVTGADVSRLLPGLESTTLTAYYCGGSGSHIDSVSFTAGTPFMSSPGFHFGGMPSMSSSSCKIMAPSQSVVCPRCKRPVIAETTVVQPPPSPASQEGGYVKGVVTYMVMDDLSVKPMSIISSITLLNKFDVKEVGSLEEKVVNLTVDDGVKLLKAALQSKTVLTDVFLKTTFFERWKLNHHELLCLEGYISYSVTNDVVAWVCLQTN